MRYFLFISIMFGVNGFCQSPGTHKVQLKKEIFGADTVIKEIPTYKDGRYSIFYQSAKELADTLSLNHIDSGFDSLQIRIWYPEMSTRKMILISRFPNKWVAHLYTFENEYDILKSINGFINIRTKELKPKSGWQDFSHKFFDLGITTLPNSDNIPGYPGGGADGKSYSVEVATINKYRFYTYFDPLRYSKIEQARKMMGIINLINAEFSIETQ